MKRRTCPGKDSPCKPCGRASCFACPLDTGCAYIYDDQGNTLGISRAYLADVTGKYGVDPMEWHSKEGKLPIIEDLE